MLAAKDLGAWRQAAAGGPLPGGTLPYGLGQLAQAYALTWPETQWKGAWRTAPPRAAGSVIRRVAPGLSGSLTACWAWPRLRRADVALSIFENAGLGFARLRALMPPGYEMVPHVLMACWLAEDCQHMRAAQLRSVRRSIKHAARVAVFSANQAPILTECLGLEARRVSVVPFGVDTEYYTPAAAWNQPGGGNQAIAGKQAGGGGLVAVGRDARRDYATLLEAVRMAGVPLTLACHPRNIRGLRLPPGVTVRHGISHAEYRRLLLAADLVVTPTTAPAYPSGQSVVLEAMSMGRATLTTDSPAMRDYVTDGTDGILVPPGDPGQLAKLIDGLLADAAWRRSLGEAAAATVRARFSLPHLWGAVADLLAAPEPG